MSNHTKAAATLVGTALIGVGGYAGGPEGLGIALFGAVVAAASTYIKQI